MDAPKVSVIVPVFNAEKFLGQCLDSILAQQCDFPFEVIVGDDGSTDRSSEILGAYAEKYPDVIVPVINPVNLGPVKNYYALIERARGEYLAFCDNDDFWDSRSKLHRQAAVLDKDKGVILTYSDCHVLHESTGRLEVDVQKSRGLKAPSGYLYEQLMQKNCISAVTVCCRTKEAQEAIREHKMRERQEWTTFDYPLWLALSLKGRFVYFDEALAVHRKQLNSVSRSQSAAKRMGFKYGIWKVREYFLSMRNVSPKLRQEILCDAGNRTVLYLFKNKKFSDLRAFARSDHLRISSRRAKWIVWLFSLKFSG